MRERKKQTALHVGRMCGGRGCFGQQSGQTKKIFKKVHQSESKADLHQFVMLMMKYNEADIRDGK